MSIGIGVFMPVRARYLGQRCWERGAVVDACGKGIAVGRIERGMRQEGGAEMSDRGSQMENLRSRQERRRGGFGFITRCNARGMTRDGGPA